MLSLFSRRCANKLSYNIRYGNIKHVGTRNEVSFVYPFILINVADLGN
jgi:hypothetical protein